MGWFAVLLIASESASRFPSECMLNKKGGNPTYKVYQIKVIYFFQKIWTFRKIVAESILNAEIQSCLKFTSQLPAWACSMHHALKNNNKKDRNFLKFVTLVIKH